MPTKTTPGTVTISDDAIRQRAYYLWEADGRPEGRSEHYWHLAMTEAAHMQAAPAPETRAEKPAKAAGEAASKPATKTAAKTAAKTTTKSDAKPPEKAKAVADKPAKATRRSAAPA